MTSPEQDEIARLRAAERRLQSIAANAPDFILQFDRDGTISYMNRPAPGHTLDDMIGSNVRRWMEPENHEGFNRTVEKVFATGQLSSYESVGSVSGRHYINRVSPVLESGRVGSAILITHDVTDLKEMVRQLEEVDARYRALVDSSFEGLVLSIGGRVIAANPAAAKLFGYTVDEMVGLTPASITTPESAALIARNIANQEESPYEITGIRSDGSRFPCEALGRTITYEGQEARMTGLRDLSERHRREAEKARLEERLHQAEKLETLGLLAGGIAHDFNNLLTVILANIELALPLPNDPREIEKSLQLTRAAALRAGELTNQLLLYAGRGLRQTEPVDLNGIVRETSQLLQTTLPGGITLQLNLAPDLSRIQGDSTQLRQVAMNLIINAAEAYGEMAGAISVITGSLHADADFLLDCFGGVATPGDFIMLEVTDDARGMDRALLARIFEPFFTTKPRGKGLGLASVQGIVRAHRGAIRVKTGSTGTTFCVLFPWPAEPAEPDAHRNLIAPER